MNLTRQAVVIAIGVVMSGLAEAPAGEPATARDYYERGLIREKNKEIEGALADYSKAVALDPQFLDAWFTRGCLYDEQTEYGKAIADYSEVIKLKPGDCPALFNRALAHENLREYDEAIAGYSEILNGDTDFSRSGDGKNKGLAHAHHYRGRIYQWHKQDYAKAIVDYDETLRLDPKVDMVHYLRGESYHALGEYANAEADYAAALKQDPDYPNLLNSWAWQLSTCPDPKFRDGKRAMTMASRANERFRGRVAGHLDTLAAACAESGRFDQAIKWQKLALERLGDKDVKKRASMQERLELYQGNRPFRETPRHSQTGSD